MAHLIDLNPLSTISEVVLPATGSINNVNLYVPNGIYSDPGSEFYSVNFLYGAVDQVAYTYKKLGGDVLDIEVTEGTVYANYEEAVLEYSYIVNIHQAKNSLSRMLGSQTGSFDSDGTLTSGSLKTSLSGSHVGQKFPKFSFDYANSIMQGVSNQVPVGQAITEYSASFSIVLEQQDYDLQQAVQDMAASGSFGPYFSLGNKRVKVTKVFYITPQATWRFFGQYGVGGFNVIGNLSNYSGYGQYTDDSTWQVVPVWQNILQAQAYREAITVRCSNYSYELNGSKIRIYPTPQIYSPDKFWFRFTLENSDIWNEKIEDDGAKLDSGLNGINNLNNAPFESIPYNDINSIGKNWIKRFCYLLSLETLGQIRSKFDPLPIPNTNISLNGKELISNSQKGQEDMRKELFEVLDQLTYAELTKRDAELLDSTKSIAEKIPNMIYIG